MSSRGDLHTRFKTFNEKNLAYETQSISGPILIKYVNNIVYAQTNALLIWCIWDIGCSPISDKIHVLFFFYCWQLIVADCDYSERYGWFLFGGNADSSQAVNLLPDDS